jgi:hypothetical protein
MFRHPIGQPEAAVSGRSAATSQDPGLLRRLLRARDRMDASSHEDWPVRRLARVGGGGPLRAIVQTGLSGTAQTLSAIVAKGAMPPLVLAVDDCRAAYDGMRARGVEFTQEPMDRYGTVDAGFRDPSGNGWKMIEARR